MQEQLARLEGDAGGLLVEVSPEWYEFRPPPELRQGNCPWGPGWVHGLQPCEWRSGHGETIRQTRQLLDANGMPVIASKAYHDAEGNPIVFPNGQPVALRPGLQRYHFVFGDIPTANKLIDLAKCAGAAVQGLVLPDGEFAPHAMWSSEDDLRWFYGLHEIAWKNYPGSSLKAERMTWYVASNGSPISFRVDQLDHFRTAQFPEGLSVSVNQNIPDPPTYVYSELPDLITASASAIDVLLSFADGSES